VGDYFVAITDPGSGLEQMAKDLSFRKIFLNDPDIGGRYSALSYFGLVPAALLGVDILRLLDNAKEMASTSQESVLLESGKNSASWLGAIMGALSKEGIDKLTFFSSPSIKHFGTWIEQLVAESTGKLGKGILPVDGTEPEPPENYSNDRIFIYMKVKGEDDYDTVVDSLEEAGHPVVRLTLDSKYDLGGEIFRWEIATIVAGHILEINPFDQPDVESAKVRAREMVAEYKEKGKLPELQATLESEGLRIYYSEKSSTVDNMLSLFLDHLFSSEKTVHAHRYLAIQAYINPSEQVNSILNLLRTKIQNQFGVAVTIGYGPRFLHSTGQLHKGDGGNGVFLQLLADMPNDCNIPDSPTEDKSSISFGILKTAQAMGDRQALIDAGRDVMTIDLGSDIEKGIQRLIDVIE
jgi:hypothetical protein